jgi:hypothetical protein
MRDRRGDRAPFGAQAGAVPSRVDGQGQGRPSLRAGTVTGVPHSDPNSSSRNFSGEKRAGPPQATRTLKPTRLPYDSLMVKAVKILAIMLDLTPMLCYSPIHDDTHTTEYAVLHRGRLQRLLGSTALAEWRHMPAL